METHLCNICCYHEMSKIANVALEMSITLGVAFQLIMEYSCKYVV